MRALAISVTLFLLMVGGIVLGTRYGIDVCDRMNAALDALPNEPSEACSAQAEQLSAYWQKQTPYLRPILNRTVVRTMSDLVSDLVAYASPTLQAEGDFVATKQRLYGAVDEMRRGEKATFGLWA